MKFINLTPHDVVICDSSGNQTRTLPRSGRVARVETPEFRSVADLDGISVTPHAPLKGRRLVNLPEPCSGTVYVTSILCLPAARELGRRDVVAPDTDRGAVRGTDGRIVGTTGFVAADESPPDVVVRFGSSTYRDDFRDVDLLVHGDPELALSMMTAPPDVHEQTPYLDANDGCWVVEVPTWGPGDLSEPAVEYCGPTLWPVEARRVVVTSGPAQVRRFAALGLVPERWDLRVEVDTAESVGTRSYGSAGIAAWARALEKVPEDRFQQLPRAIQDIHEAIEFVFGHPDTDKFQTLVQGVARLARDLRQLSSQAQKDLPADMRRDLAGFSSGGSSFFIPCRRSGAEFRLWCAPYAGTGYATLRDLFQTWFEWTGNGDLRSFLDTTLYPTTWPDVKVWCTISASDPIGP